MVSTLDTTQPVPQTLSRKAVNCKPHASSLPALIIYRSNFDLLQQLCEQAGLIDSMQRLRVIRHGLKLFLCTFLQFLWCSSLRKEPNDYSWCLLSQIDSYCCQILFLLRQDSKKLQAFTPAKQLKRKTAFSSLNFDVHLRHGYKRFVFDCRFFSCTMGQPNSIICLP